MGAKYCLYLNNGLNFHYSGLTFCNKLWIGSDFQKYEGDYLKTFFENREKVLADMKNGIAPEHCRSCMYLKDYEGGEITPKIKYMEIYHWNECNCACFYCSNRNATKLKMTQKRNIRGVIDVMPNLKKLQKENLLDDKLEATLLGGEPSLLKEFPDILKFFIKNKYGISILSNGIYYEKYIPRALRAGEKSFLTVSLDSGSREMFKRIKRADKFDEVLKNIKRYVKDSKEASNKIMMKYIILEGVNDSKEEINKFIDVCAQAGVTNYFPAIEFCHSVKDENSKLSENVCSLYEYIKTRVKEVNSGFTVASYDFVEELIKKHSYKIR